ncbi:hypothetical protein RY831_11690 [Noviherbaspirillum sp. CPCC 100848]|uniref:UrcA family protein n=1 Tax=Noviherbaspirillum album TaxID=3080276 RepID=A0ABU6J854_9BURK|nr:hypothetical protein [Noviherbaspirillum sp. CPCC 100848]MEC4719814.1 hypothetical protein [Noviherbaspirillum sp. CPCC 100848]
MISSRYLLRKAFILAAVMAGTATAQTPQMVEVSLTNIKAAIAKEVQADVEKVPLMVKVPVETAKEVCNLTAEGLAPQANSGVPSCPAVRTSTALNDVVRQEIMKASLSR